MALNPADATERVEQLILLTDKLTALIAEQAQAFEGRRPQDAAAMLGDITPLANLYRHESAKVRADPGLVTAAAPDARKRLVQATEAFDAVLARQGRAIEAARVITEGLVKCIADEVAAQRTQATTYGSAGVQKATPYAASAITLNRRA